MRNRSLFFLWMAAIVLVASDGDAAICGDDVEGRRVACRCGDTVVSDVVLRADDPVVTTRCRIDGLIVRAAPDAASIRIDLAGLRVQGSGVASGIDVRYGGTDGASIIGAAPGGHGVISGFGVGLVGSGAEAIARVSRLELRNHRHEGARLTIAGTILDDVIAHANHGDGLYLRGTGGRLVGVHCYDNFENGIRLFVRGAAVEARVHHNGRSGIIVDGPGNDLSGVEANDNLMDGVVARNSTRRSPAARSAGNGRRDLVWNGVSEASVEKQP